ncbi:PREDICTED: U4/U6.U5 tri-snRNP-associated protein 2 [Myotis brandtii]|uniref:U4/U6.U5 tri-snRNP-associated protein 2 n=1 Tax=Myotis brandtii TaxID=109478 RepID=UPI000704447D|nr:PREDICTED: U4/U6.U5 tri-snRNP-associated protein 2 [Myotis brandtii]
MNARIKLWLQGLECVTCAAFRRPAAIRCAREACERPRRALDAARLLIGCLPRAPESAAPAQGDFADSEPEREVRAKNGRVDSEDRRSRHCPYLDTINRSVLDFDFEKLCSIFLSHINAYACLVCGKYFQGRGLKSHAYIHSVQFSHHVFLNLHTLKFYCLPDNYEIIDSSLEDSPVLEGQRHFCGEDRYKIIYTNNYNGTMLAYIAKILLCLVTALDLMLGRCSKSEIQKLGLYFGNVCQPDRVCILISVCAAIVTDVFQGSMRIFTKKLPHPDLPAEEKEQLLHNDEYQETMVESTFMYLTLDLPTAPLYKDEKEQLIIPQVPLFNILAKFNGITEKEYKTYKENFLKRFQLTKLPPYLIFCIKRFTKNNFFVEKNPTIVNFPITNVDLREYLSEEVQAVHKNTTYDLIANIVHDGKPSEGSYRIHVLHHVSGADFSCTEGHTQLVFLWRLRGQLPSVSPFFTLTLGFCK